VRREKVKKKKKTKPKRKNHKARMTTRTSRTRKLKTTKYVLPGLFLVFYSHIVQIKELSKSKEQSEAELGPRIFQLSK
jgi:hypothetical protein